jgi:arsenite-transporting ATPase
VLHDSVTQELEVSDGEARLRIALPFANKADVKLKKIGLELVVAVDGQKRTIMLPDALAGFRPTAATLEQGALEVTFNGG